MTETVTEGFTAETFAAFWAKPDLTDPAAASPIAEDVVGYWPGEEEPVRGREAYVAALRKLLARVPDLTLSIAESAHDGENLFIRWVAHATGAEGRRIEHSGVDRIKVVDGKVVENRIFFDRAQFERKLGKSLDL
jgi:hypothetical protein